VADGSTAPKAGRLVAESRREAAFDGDQQKANDRPGSGPEAAAWWDLVVAGQALTFPVGLLLVMLLTRLLSPEEVGSYFAAMSVIMLIAGVAPLGLGPSMIKLVASALATDRPRAARSAIQLGSAVVASVGLAAALALLGPPGDWLIGLLTESGQLERLLPLMALMVIGFIATEFSSDVLRGFHDLFGASLLAEQLSQRVLIVALLAGFRLGASSLNLEQVFRDHPDCRDDQRGDGCACGRSPCVPFDATRSGLRMAADPAGVSDSPAKFLCGHRRRDLDLGDVSHTGGGRDLRRSQHARLDCASAVHSDQWRGRAGGGAAPQ
jgi:hypothetical protein